MVEQATAAFRCDVEAVREQPLSLERTRTPDARPLCLPLLAGGETIGVPAVLTSRSPVPARYADALLTERVWLLNGNGVAGTAARLRDEIHKLKDVMKESINLGMKTFDQALFELYQAGEISYEDALRYADSANEVRLKIKLAQGGDAHTLAAGLDGVEVAEVR